MFRIIFSIWLLLLPCAASAGSMTLLGVGNSASAAVPMVTPLMVTGNDVAPSNTAANYISFSGGQWGGSTARDAPASISGTINGLTVRLATVVASGSYVFTLYKNQTATGLACTISSGTTCTNNTSVSVSPGDTLMWQSCPGTHSGIAGSCTPATATAQTAGISVSALYTSTTPGESFVTLGKAIAPSTTATNYYCFCAPVSSSWNATEALLSGIIPTATTLDQLRIDASAPGAGKTLTLTVYQNGAATLLSCSLTGTGSGSGITSCSDTTHSISASPGDTLSIQSTVSGTPTTGNTGASLRSVPTVPGEAIVMNAVSSFMSTSSPRYMAVADGQNSSTENTFSLVPVALTVKKTFCALDTAPGGAASRTWQNRYGTGSGQSTGAISCALTSTSTNSDTAHTYSASVNDLISWLETPAGTPPTNTTYKFSSVLATQ